MKLIVVSDLHLVSPDAKLFGRDPLANLEACIESINHHHADADLVVFAGDLTNDGEVDAYDALASRIKTLVPPHRMMMGNHDDRAAFRNALPGQPEENGFIQSAFDCGATRLIFLDTLWEGHVEGLLCADRLSWLDQQLATAQSSLIFMHHPPFEVGIPSMDECRLSNPDDLLNILQDHQNIGHIFAGHVHCFSHGMWENIPFTTLRSTNHQTALKFSGPHEVSLEAPAYSIVLQRAENLIIHNYEFPTAS